MENELEKIYHVTNSDIIKHTLFSLVTIAKSKTTDQYAWSVIKNLLNELKKNHEFLKYIHIGEIEKLKNKIDDILITPEFNNIKPEKIGEAIQDIVDYFKTNMGKKAGYFFLTEFKDDLGEEYNIIIKKIGVDLRLIDLKKEVYGFESKKYRIKDDFNSNIAYLQKKE